MRKTKNHLSSIELLRVLCFSLCMIVQSNVLSAQINAVTEQGDPVLLYPNGTWEYLSDSATAEVEIPMNTKEFKKDEQAIFLVKSQKAKMGVWINPKKWTFSKAPADEASEFSFEKKGEDLYALLVSEKLEIPIENLADIAYENARNAAADITIQKKEYRTVNGIKVLMMQMSGSVSGMKITYYGYYYSNADGTVQLLAYTGTKLLDTYKSEIELLLNGLVETQ